MTGTVGLGGPGTGPGPGPGPGSGNGSSTAGSASVHRLRLARLARQLSQDQLAEAAGVTRQTVAGIETGRFDPSLKVALRFAEALGASVEELFGSREATKGTLATGVVVVDPKLGHQRDRTRVRLVEVRGRSVAFPLADDAAVGSGFLPASGILHPAPVGSTEPRRDAVDPPLASQGGSEGSSSVMTLRSARPTLVVAGCDPALSLLADPLSRLDPPIELLWWSCSSARALGLMAAGVVHAAGAHLKDPRGAGYNAHEARRALDGLGGVVVGFGAWAEGLALGPELVGTIANLGDVARHGLRVVNREPGSGARAVFERQRRRYGLSVSELPGWEVVLPGHLPVAAAVASGLASTGVTCEPAARVYGLGFASMTTEQFDLVVPRDLLGLPEVRGLMAVLGADGLRRQLFSIEGYDAGRCGEVLDSF